MDCTAAILKPCACSRTKWCRHERSSNHRRPWRLLHGCSCGRGVMEADVVNHASSLLRRLLLYVCCCLSSEDSPELRRNWVAPPINGAQRGGRREEEGESEVISRQNRVLPGEEWTVFVSVLGGWCVTVQRFSSGLHIFWYCYIIGIQWLCFFGGGFIKRGDSKMTYFKSIVKTNAADSKISWLKIPNSLNSIWIGLHPFIGHSYQRSHLKFVRTTFC